MWASISCPTPLLVRSMFFFIFLGVLTPFSRKMSRAVLGFGRFWARFWKVLGSILEASGDNLSLRLLLENLRLLLENRYLQFRLLLENLLFRSILLASGSGWAGGVTRSAKNFNYKSRSFSERLPLSSVTQTLTSKVDFAIVPHFKDYAA